MASDAELVVIGNQSLEQEYRYCDYAQASRGFQVLVGPNFCGAGSNACSTVIGVAQSYILYDTATSVDSPACGGPNPFTEGTTTVYATDTSAGSTVTLAQGQGGVSSAQFMSSGIGAWILTYDQCPLTGGNQRTETLDSYSVRTGAVTTLDTGDAGETTNSPASLGNLELYGCAGGCAPNTAILAWTHDGAWRYQRVS